MIAPRWTRIALCALVWFTAGCSRRTTVPLDPSDTESPVELPTLAPTAIPTTPAASSIFDFGGIFGYYQSAQSLNPLVLSPYVNFYANLATNAPSCPIGYTATPFLGSPGVDHVAVFCWREGEAGREPEFDFGGMFGDGEAGVNTYPNPVNGQFACPDGFEKRTAAGTYGLDWNLYYCMRPHVAGTVSKFAGLHGLGQVNGANLVYVNPATNGASCPAGATSHAVHGAYGVDWAAHLCLGQ